MASHVALLRAINVGGRNMVGMADLKACLAGNGIEDVVSVLQSGNLVLTITRSRTDADLERMMEQAIRARFGLAIDVFVRSAKEWTAIMSGNPFPERARRDPGHLLVMALKSAPTPARVSDLEASIVGRELVTARGRDLYLVYPDGVGRSKLTTALIEKTLQTRGTGRNWNTVMKLGTLVGSHRQG